MVGGEQVGFENAVLVCLLRQQLFLLVDYRALLRALSVGSQAIFEIEAPGARLF